MWWAREQVMVMDATAASAWDASVIVRHAQDVHGIQIYVIDHWSTLGVGEERAWREYARVVATGTAKWRKSRTIGCRRFTEGMSVRAFSAFPSSFPTKRNCLILLSIHNLHIDDLPYLIS